MRKVCTRCGIEQDEQCFHRASKRSDGLQPWCKSCHEEVRQNRDRDKDRERAKKYYIANRERMREQGRKAHLRRKFGLSPLYYDQLLQYQNGTCAICGKEDESGRRLAVDHDHQTGKIRGLLCTRCNRLIGISRDDGQLLVSAAEYIWRTSE